jgi:hypothetical protein
MDDNIEKASDDQSQYQADQGEAQRALLQKGKKVHAEGDSVDA